MRDGNNRADDNEPLFVDCFANDNYFTAALNKNSIAGVDQDNDEKNNDN